VFIYYLSVVFSPVTILSVDHTMNTKVSPSGAVHDALTMQHLRRCLKIIRDPLTEPSTILPNGETAGSTAHRYVLEGNKKRNQQKSKRENKNQTSIEATSQNDDG